MAFETTLIIILLGIIVYQLYRMIKMKEFELEQKRQEKEDRRIQGCIPHLFTDAANDEKVEEFRKFHYNYEAHMRDMSIYRDTTNPYTDPNEYYFEQMKKRVKQEQNKEKKAWGDRFLKEIEKNTDEMIKKIIEEKESTLEERCFVCWRYLKNEYELFSERIEEQPTEFSKLVAFSPLMDLVKDSYISAFPEKRKP